MGLSFGTRFPHASSSAAAASSSSSSSFLLTDRSGLPGPATEVRKGRGRPTNLPRGARGGGAARDASAPAARPPAPSPRPPTPAAAPAAPAPRPRTHLAQAPPRPPPPLRALRGHRRPLPGPADSPPGRAPARPPRLPLLGPPRPDKDERRGGRRRSPSLGARRASRVPRSQGAVRGDSRRAASGPALEGGAGRQKRAPSPGRLETHTPGPEHLLPARRPAERSRSALCRPPGLSARAVPLQLRAGPWARRSPKASWRPAGKEGVRQRGRGLRGRGLRRTGSAGFLLGRKREDLRILCSWGNLGSAMGKTWRAVGVLIHKKPEVHL